jgi:enoyl-CoA hydratase
MIQREIHGRVTLLRMDDGKVNALNTEFLQALLHELSSLEMDSDSAVVITGNAKVFSAGLDLYRVLREDNSYITSLLVVLNEVILKLFTFPRPVVAAINGHAIAGGCILACACDYRLMAEGKGTIGIPELLVGVPFPTLALEVIRFAVPPPAFQEMVYTGRTLLAGDALTKGLVHEKVPPSVLLSNAFQRAEQMGKIPPEAFQVTKRQLVEPMLEKLSRGEIRHEQDVTRVWLSSSTKTMIKHYLDQTVGKKSKG